MKKQKVAFFDRDGTININFGHVYKIEDLEFVPEIPEKIREYNQANIPVIVITNQSGIARGMYTLEDVHLFHKEMNRRLKEEYSAHIDGFFICPHHPDFTGDCGCRKPKEGLFLQALCNVRREYEIDFPNSVMYGDKETDRLAAEAVGITDFVLVTCENNV